MASFLVMLVVFHSSSLIVKALLYPNASLDRAYYSDTGELIILPSTPIVLLMKCDEEPPDTVQYYSIGLHYEYQGKYKEAIKNYDIYSKKLGKRKPEVYTRALYYSNKKSESARAYYDVIQQFRTWLDQKTGLPRLYDGTITDEVSPHWFDFHKRIISNPYGLPEPFTTIEDLRQFLNGEENAFLRKEEHFEETMNFPYRSRAGVNFGVIFVGFCGDFLGFGGVKGHRHDSALRPTHATMLATLRRRNVIPLLHPRTRNP